MSTLGKALKQLREGLGLSQDDLAKKSGLSAAWIRRLEQGQLPQAEHQIESLRTVAAAVGYSLPAFLREAGVVDADVNSIEGDPGLRELIKNISQLDDESRQVVETIVRKLAQRGRGASNAIVSL